MLTQRDSPNVDIDNPNLSPYAGGAMKLTRVHRLDSIRLDESFFTSEGFFIDTPIVTRVGVFEYKNPDGSIRRELRLPEHVFDDESLSTYEGKSVIITHAAGRVDKDNVADEIVGTVLSKGYRDGENVRAKVVIHDIESVKSSGLRELSLGYDLVLDETPGTWNGQSYDAVQTKIKVNHLALVRDARAGDSARLNLDSRSEQFLKGATKMGAQTKKPMSGSELIAALEAKMGRRADSKELALIKEIAELDGADSTAADTAADAAAADAAVKNGDKKDTASPEDKIKAIKEKYDARRKDTTPSPDADKLPDLLKQQDADIGDLLGIVETMQAKADFDNAAKDNADAGKGDGNADKTDKADSFSSDDIDAIITERLSLARLGDRLNLDGLELMKPIDAKKAIVAAVNPNMRLDGKGEVYVQAAFDNAVDQFNSRKDVDYQRRQMSTRHDGAVPGAQDKPGALSAREAMTQKMMNGGNE